MNGKTLYELYVQRTLELQNCEIEESWEDLGKSDQDVWNALATDVNGN